MIKKEKIIKEKIVKIPKISTNDLTKSVITMLGHLGFNVWRQNNGAVYDPTRRAFRSNSSTPGISDIIGYRLNSGQFIAVEIKNGKDVMSEAQTKFLNALNENGGIGLIVRNMDDVENLKQLNE